MMDLLKRLQRALPWVERWIDELHVRHLPESVLATQTGFTRLSSYFPESLLKSTRVAVVHKIPFPPVSKYGVPEFEMMANMPMSGITFRDMYFVQPSYSSEGVHFHELVHIVQWSTLGVREFLLTYALGIAQCGYAQSPLEAIAYDLQARFEQRTPLQSVPELVARLAVDARDSAAEVFAMYGLALGA